MSRTRAGVTTVAAAAAAPALACYVIVQLRITDHGRAYPVSVSEVRAGDCVRVRVCACFCVRVYVRVRACVFHLVQRV